MNKFLTAAICIFTILSIVFFFMWRSSHTKNVQLSEQNQALVAQIEMMQNTIVEKNNVISAQNKKYQEILSAIEYNDCENLPVSTTLVQAAKDLQ